MITRGIVGRRIAAIEQQRMTSSGGEARMSVVSITLDDGTVLFPMTIESNDASFYGHDFEVNTTERVKIRKESKNK